MSFLKASVFGQVLGCIKDSFNEIFALYEVLRGSGEALFLGYFWVGCILVSFEGNSILRNLGCWVEEAFRWVGLFQLPIWILIIMKEFCATIRNHLKPLVIFKLLKNKVKNIIVSFESLHVILYILGAIDDNHIPIVAIRLAHHFVKQYDTKCI